MIKTKVFIKQYQMILKKCNENNLNNLKHTNLKDTIIWGKIAVFFYKSLTLTVLI